jgi:hypothetical protein
MLAFLLSRRTRGAAKPESPLWAWRELPPVHPASAARERLQAPEGADFNEHSIHESPVLSTFLSPAGKNRPGRNAAAAIPPGAAFPGFAAFWRDCCNDNANLL